VTDGSLGGTIAGMANGSVSGVSYLIAASAGALLGGAGMWWWARRQTAGTSTLSATPRMITETQAFTAASQQRTSTSQQAARQVPGVVGNAAVTRHTGCASYDENQQPPASLLPASLRYQDIWNDRAVMDAAWFARIRPTSENSEPRNLPTPSIGRRTCPM
jgi:hypothetical protein